MNITIKYNYKIEEYYIVEKIAKVRNKLNILF